MNKLTGKWKLTDVKGNSDSMAGLGDVLSLAGNAGMTFHMVLEKDGSGAFSFSMLGQNQSQAIGWEADKDKFILKDKEKTETTELAYKLEGEKLTLEKEGFSMVFEKDK